MYRLINGDNRQILKQFPDNHFDSIVTDPPYGIDFLGKSWDANTGALDTYQECLRVLKPGGHILAFSAPRTYHHLAITLEQAGFEIRDQIMWIYSSGFPKSQDVGRTIQRGLGVKETLKSKGMNAYALVKDKKGREKWMNPGNITSEDYPEKKDIVKPTDPLAQQWAGWGTALKPAHEPIALARKPIKTSIARNVEKYGTGALNIDATRVPYESEKDKNSIDHKVPTAAWSGHTEQVGSYVKGAFEKVLTNDIGRFPSNVIGEIEELYQKYFYCPKVSRQERHCGFDLKDIPSNPDAMYVQGTNYSHRVEEERTSVKTYKQMIEDMGGHYLDINGNIQDINQPSKDVWLPEDGHIKAHVLKDTYETWCIRHNKPLTKGNNHPTVKPVALMEYLIKLVTPPNGLVLDPFNGSGSTGMAAVGLGFDYIGIDLDPNYIEISKKRIDAWYALQNPNLFKELFEDAVK